MLNSIWKRGVKSMSKHPWLNSWTHVAAGIGIGIILARPLAADHPIRWGIAVLAVSVLMHLYMTFMMRK